MREIQSSGKRTRMSRPCSKKKVGVCLVSSHPLILAKFQEQLLTSDFQLQTCRITAEDGTVALPRADVYVVDSFRHQPLTEELVATIMSRSPASVIVVLADSFPEPIAFPLLRLGVKGLLQYSDAEPQLPGALQAVSAGGYWVPRTTLGRMLEHIWTTDRRQRGMHMHTTVSPRQRQILKCLLENLSNKEIGERLNISERTVKFHVSNLLSKYGVRRRADLILLSYQTEQVSAAEVP
ncbi:MAG: response regulator transcription factor [Acidobacteriia bacterium]|nr:response regulator transcription factor [Terriglobia bacterium]